MRKRIGLSFFSGVLLLSGCATPLPVPTFPDVERVNEKLKVTISEYKPYKVSGLASVECQSGHCTMTEADFRTNQNDKWNLHRIVKMNYQKDVLRIEAFNTLVDAYSHSQLAAAKKEAAILQLESTLNKERTYRTLKTWIERVLFFAGVVVFGSL